MGAGAVSSVVLDYLLLLHLERSKVYREGRTIICMYVRNFHLTLRLLTNAGSGKGCFVLVFFKKRHRFYQQCSIVVYVVYTANSNEILLQSFITLC